MFEITDVYVCGTPSSALFGVGSAAVRSGNSTGVTTTVAAALALPPGPVQVIVYVYVPAGDNGPVDWVFGPPIAFEPDQPPDALQLVTFADVQVSADEPPTATVVGKAEIVTVG
jgi:hypothetical protein